MLHRIVSFFEKIDPDTRLTIAGLLFLILSWIMDFFRLGPSIERFAYLFLLVLMLAFYILVVSERIRAESNMTRELERHLTQVTEIVEMHLKQTAEIMKRLLPQAVFIENEEDSRMELIKAVKNADKYILTTGGKSRNPECLHAIEERVLHDGLPYTRVVLGDHIHHELCAHLCTLLGRDRVHFGHLLNEQFGNALVTESILILGIPSPHPDIFETNYESAKL